MQLKPAPQIAHIVRHYLVLKGSLPAAAAFRLFADGNTGLVFNAGNASLRYGGDAEKFQTTWLYGQLSHYQDFSISGSLQWIVVVLQPYGAFHCWGVPGTEWKDRFFPAAEQLGTAIDTISAALLQSASIQDSIRLLDAWITAQQAHRKQPDPVLIQAVQSINASEGRMPVHALLQQLLVNERMLERKFKEAIGISPKQYAGIIRVNASAKKMQRIGKLTEVAYDGDYFDQAHFIKDFRKYTGITPWQYQQVVDPLALNFIKL